MSEIKALRHRAHEALDNLRNSGRMTHEDATRWMCRTLGLSKRQAHISKMDGDQCRRLIKLIKGEG